jgi:hypothetical protein
MSSDARRGTLCDDISCEGGFDDVVWGRQQTTGFCFHKPRPQTENMRIADCETEVKYLEER